MAKEDKEKERTMKLSIKEGMASSVMSGVTDSYITPYALALNANNAQIGFLSSFPSILSPLSQIFGSRMMEKYSRKRLIVTSVFFHALMWLPIAFLSIFFWKSLFLSYLPIILIAFYSILAISSSIAGPAWFSLLGELVPEKIRGRYFSRRNKICGAIALAGTILASFILDFFKTHGLILVGFSILFIIACIARLISSFLFTKHYYPKLKLEKGYYFSFFSFLKQAPKNNFGKFVIYIALMNFAVNLAGPFFTVYMLKDLGFSYITFMLVNISATITTLLFLPLLGKFSDKYGNRELLRFGSILVPLIPILWILSPSPIYLILVPQVISGLGWAAFSFASSNFIYDSVSCQRRGLCVAYYNVLVGLGVFLGAITGGLLAQYLTISFMNKFLFLFLVSGILRFIIALFVSRIKEIRKVNKPKPHPLLYFSEIKPSAAFSEIVNDVKNLFKS